MPFFGLYGFFSLRFHGLTKFPLRFFPFFIIIREKFPEVRKWPSCAILCRYLRVWDLPR